MSGHIFVSYATIDHGQGSRLVAFLRAMLGSDRVAARSGVARVTGQAASAPQAGPARSSELTGADLVLALLTPHALASGEVPFELGAAWALRKRCVLLRTSIVGPHDVSPWLSGPVDAIPLTPEALIELARSLSGETPSNERQTLELNPSAQSALQALFPDWRPLARSEPMLARDRAAGAGADRTPTSIRPASVPPSLPLSCKNSLLSGRAVSDSVFARRRGDALAHAAALDLTFGPFIAALGEDWGELRKRDDPEQWHAIAQQELAKVAERRAPGHWYRMGFELGTLINLAGSELRADVPANEAFDASWQSALDALCEAGLREHVNAAALAEVARLLDGLRTTPALRDYANLSRAQNRLRQLAAERDQAPY